MKQVCLVELTICYETHYEEAHRLKEEKYIDLVEEIREAGKYTPQLITLEVGSRGPFYPTGFEKLRRFLKAPVKSWEPMLCEAIYQDCPDRVV